MELLLSFSASISESNCNFILILPYDSRPIPRPEKQTTSPAFPGRRISRADGPDLAFPGHFANKSSYFIEINSRSNLLSQKILQKNHKYFSKSTRGPTSSLSSFCKKTPKLFRNTTRRPNLIGLACHSLRGPQWAEFSPMLVCLIYYFFSITNKFAQTLKLLSKSQKNRKIENQIVSEYS
jgi:hypothetical protein